MFLELLESQEMVSNCEVEEDEALVVPPMELQMLECDVALELK